MDFLISPLCTAAEAAAFETAAWDCPSDSNGAQAWGDRTVEALAFAWTAIAQAHQRAYPTKHPEDRLQGVVLSTHPDEPRVLSSGRIQQWRERPKRLDALLAKRATALTVELFSSSAFGRAENVLWDRFHGQQGRRPWNDPWVVPLTEQGAVLNSLMDANHARRRQAVLLKRALPLPVLRKSTPRL